MHVVEYLIVWWEVVWCGLRLWYKRNCLHFWLVCKPWFEMALDACMRIYLFTFNILFLSICIICGCFNYFIYILNVCFKFWAGQPTIKWFYIYFKYFTKKNYFKLYKIICFIKSHFCHYSWVRGVTIYTLILAIFSLHYLSYISK